jgi:hypothetical protein
MSALSSRICGVAVVVAVSAGLLTCLTLAAARTRSTNLLSSLADFAMGPVA